MIETALRRLALFASRRYGLVLLVALGLAALAIVPARQLRFDTDVFSLLPPEDPAVETFMETVEVFGSLEQLLVVVRIPEGELVDPYLDFTERLGRRLGELEEVDEVEYSIGEVEELIETFLGRAFLFLGPEERARVLERLSDEGIRQRVGELRRRIATPQALFARSLLQLDPLGLSELLVADLGRSRGALKLDWSTGYLLSQDARLVLLIVRPVRSAIETEFSKRLLGAARGAADEVVAGWDELAGPDPPPPPTVDFGGTYATVVEDAGKLTQDVALNVGTAMVGVLFLFAVAFRRISLAGYAFLPIGLGVIMTFGFAGYVFGVLGAVSSGFAALLAGLALDFVIVSYGRYVEERQAGAKLEDAIAAMAETSGRAVVTGAVTTAVTFFAFYVTEFAGLRELGLLGGTGILFCMAAVLILLPAMMAWSEHRRHRRTGRVHDLRLHAFGFGQVVKFCFGHPRLALAAAVALTAVAGYYSLDLEFEDDFRKMRPPGARGVEIQNEVARSFGSGFESMMLVVHASNEDELLERVHRAEKGARALVENGVLRGTDSLATLVPSAEEQAAAIEWLREHEEFLDGARLKRVFAAAAAEEGLRAEAFERGLDFLAVAAAARTPIRLGDAAVGQQAEKLLRRYVRETEVGYTAVVHLQIPPREWKLALPPEARELVDELGPDFQLTGANILGEQLRNQIRTDAVTACVVGFFLVGLLLYLEYRRIADTVFSLLPLAIGMVWMLGGMVVVGMDMNFVNIFVTTMIIGIGVDYGIHMVNRFREHEDDPPEALTASLAETGRAVVLAALSTMVGFGSLSLSHYPVVRSMGLVALLGAFTTAIVAITVLPALFRLKCRR